VTTAAFHHSSASVTGVMTTACSLCFRPDLDDGETVFRHACRLGLEGIVSKPKDSGYRSGRSSDWLKMKNPASEAVKREAEEDWGR
jgi:ATP-dependent DNA ligase